MYEELLKQRFFGDPPAFALTEHRCTEYRAVGLLECDGVPSTQSCAWLRIRSATNIC